MRYEKHFEFLRHDRHSKVLKSFVLMLLPPQAHIEVFLSLYSVLYFFVFFLNKK